MFKSLQSFYKKHERWIPIFAFLSGFLFDMMMLRRIDELKVILQQAAWLVAAGVLIGVELVALTREVQPPTLFRKIWKYREFCLHFLLGTLLNSYVIFYFKSASALTSFLFILILVALLAANEFLRFGKSQLQVHVALLSLCLISYFVSLVPILMGFLGLLPYLIAVAATLGVFYGFYQVMKPLLVKEPKLLRTHVLYPFALIQVVFSGLYFGNAIPPVPLSVSYMGIYHGIEKKPGEYVLTYTRPEWKFWENGDETFLARSGDEIFCFSQIFSPARFKEQLQIRWLHWNEKTGWESQDAIPMPVVGGREEGYRAITKKSNYQPGLWRIQIETTDNREVGRLGFTIVTDDSTDARAVHTVVR